MSDFISFKLKTWLLGRVKFYSAPIELIHQLSVFGIKLRPFIINAVIGAFGKLLAVCQFGIFYKVLNAIIQARPATLYQGLMGSFLQWIIPEQWHETNCVWIVLVTASLVIKSVEIVLVYYSEKYIFDAHKELEMNIQHEVLKKILFMDLFTLEMQNSTHRRTWAENVDLINRKTQNYAESLKYTYQLILRAVSVIALSFLMLFLQYQFFFFAVTVVFIMRYLIKLIKVSVLKNKQEVESRSGIKQVRNKVSSVIGALILVKFYQQEAVESEQIKNDHCKTIQLLSEEKRMDLVESPFEDFAKMISFILITTIPPFFFKLTTKGISKIAISILIIQQIQGALDQIQKNLKMIQTALIESNEINELLSLEVVSSHQKQMHHSMPEKTIEFNSLDMKNIEFKFDDENLFLKKIDFDFKRHEKIAFVGPSGSGKSTFAKLLMGLYPLQKGQYWMNGKEIKASDSAQLAQCFSYVSQETLWFHESILENLCYGLTERPSLNEIEKLCDEIGILGVIQRSPKKWDTLLNHRGGFLSQGQAQLLSLVRAALKKAPILILDEPTSALDAFSELRALRFIEKHFENTTQIIIAHRLSSIMKAERIYYFENGSILESGSFEQLLSYHGKFQALWEAYFPSIKGKKVA